MYSPFNKPIDQLVAKDLAVLKNLPEGWFIEYKSELIDPKEIAKSVAAFANADGGWLFFGINESNPDSVTNTFPGMARDALQKCLQRIVGSVRQHVNPIPHFNTRVCDGPCTELDLKENFSIVVVQIPYSRYTPHLHSNGRIYARTSGQSAPIEPLINRFQLDLLWQRGEEVREDVRHWVKHDPEFTTNEKGIPNFRLLLMVDPWMPIPETWVKADRTKVKEILNGSSTDRLRIKFDTVHTYQEGYLCRQFSGGPPAKYGLTFQVFRNLTCELNIPLNFLETDDLADALLIDEDGYAHKEQYYHILKQQKHVNSKIVDLNVVWAYIGTAVNKYLKLLKLAQVSPAFRFKVILMNASRVVPFIDSKVVIDYFETHGLPMIMHRDFEFPSASGINSFFQIEEIENDKIVDNQGTRVFVQFLNSLGIEVVDRFEDLVLEFLMCLQRAAAEHNRLKSLRDDEDEDGISTRF